MNKIQQQDIKEFAEDFPFRDRLVGSRFLITGATGLIGSTLVHCLLALNREIEITCPVRSLEKAKAIFGEEYEHVQFVECDLTSYLNGLVAEDDFKYVVHCASPTSGKYITEHPTETFELAIDTTRAILEYARKADPQGVLYVSSLEYYGQNFDDNSVTEDMLGYVDSTDPRSSYPLGKRAAEFLCKAYTKEYGVKAKVARLTQTFGAGVSPDDNRVFAQFARSVIASEDIVLHTTGESAKPYCYTIDCISAILYILLKGTDGEAYNVANNKTYISIREMAELLCREFNPSIKVVIEPRPELGYAPVTKLNLSAAKLIALGWKPRFDLLEMYTRLIESIKDQCIKE